MNSQAWIFTMVIITFGLYIGIAIWSRVASTKGFYVAGQGVPPVLNGMATGADWMSAASFISMAGMISVLGYTGSMYLIGWTGGYVLLALLLAPFLRKFGKFTVPDFVGDRYYSNFARLVAIVCAIFVSFTYVGGQMQGVGIVFSRFLGISVELGVIIGMIIVFFYATLGGMKGITYTQVAQYVVLIIAYLVPAIAISIKLTGNPIPQLGFGSQLTEGPSAGVYLLQVLNDLHRELGFPEYTSAFGPGNKGMLDMFCIALALMAGTAGLPHVIIRFFTTRTVAGARWSAFWALLFIAILYLTAPSVAAFARVNLIQTLNQSQYSEVPEWFTKWEETGLIEFKDRDGDGLIDYMKDTEANELTVNRDIMVLANPEIANLPGWIVGFVAAGGLAAALSTAAGLLMVISSAISHDLMKRMLRPEMTEAQELVAARSAAVVAVILAALLGIYPLGFVAQVVAFAFGLAASSFFPVIVLGIFWKRTTKQGAIAGMLTGIGFTGGYIIYFKFLGGLPEHHWFGISPEGIGSLGMLINFAVTTLVSLVTPAPPQEIQDAVEELRYPEDPPSASAAH